MRTPNLAVVAGAAALASLLVSTAAHAKCATPGSAIAPHPGATVPPDPVLYVFMPTWQVKDAPRIEVRAGDRELAYEAAQVSANDAFVTLRLEIRSEDATKIEVVYDTLGVETATFVIDPAWTGPIDRSAHVLETKSVEDRWSCSYTDAHFLTVTDAPAYNVEWSEGGETKTAVFPHDIYDFFLRGGQEPGSNVGQIGLGHVSCFGRTATSGPELDLSTVVVTGLWPDGPKEATTDPEPVDGCQLALLDRDPVEPTVDDPRPREEEPALPVSLLALLAGFLGLAVGAGGVLGRRTRASASR